MNYTDLKNKSQKELQRELSEKRNELRELRFKVAGNQLANVRAIRVARKLIAQLLTAINAKRIATHIDAK